MKRFIINFLSATFAFMIITQTAMAAPRVMEDGGVFDASYYAVTNTDIFSLLGLNEEALYTHYKTAGQAEGRQPYSADIDPASVTTTTSSLAKLGALNSATFITALQSNNPYISYTVVFDENTDPNGSLGRPGKYIGKCDFADSRIEWNSFLEDDLKMGGTAEFFSTKKECSARYAYLKPFVDSGFLKEYMYKYSNVIIRVDQKITPTDAAVYKAIFDSLIGEVGETYVPN